MQGEPNDAYIGTVQVADDGASIVSQSITGTVKGPVSSINVTFDQTILTSSFTPSEVTLTGPGNTVIPVTVTLLSNSTYTLSFTPQNTKGTYTLNIGPDVLNLSDLEMDQNHNGVDGEATDNYV